MNTMNTMSVDDLARYTKHNGSILLANIDSLFSEIKKLIP